MSDKLTRQLFAILRKAGRLTRDERVRLYRWIIWRDNITSTNDLSTHELEAIVSQLRTWDQAGVLASEIELAVNA